MMMPKTLIAVGIVCLLVLSLRHASAQTDPETPSENRPTLFIAGDSTAAVNSATQQGWGVNFQDYFDSAKLVVVNGAKSGLSTPTFINSGSWDAILSKVKPNDYVIIQFGHNDNGPVDSFRFRGTMPSLGDETQEAHDAQSRPETVHTYGWYLKKMIADVLAKNANPIVISMTVRGEWTDGKIERGFGDYAKLAGELAASRASATSILPTTSPINTNKWAPRKSKPSSPATRPTPTAPGPTSTQGFIAGIKALHEYTLVNAMTTAGRAIDVAARVCGCPQARGHRPRHPDIFNRWLNLPDVPATKLPTILLIGDSTVRNGRGDGGCHRQWGWGDAFAVYIDPAKANLVNRAVEALPPRAS